MKNRQHSHRFGTLLLAAGALTLLTPGCAIRKLRDENQMLESRVQQLSQDKSAAEVRAADLLADYERLQTERDEIANEATRLRERLETVQRVLGESQKNQAEALLDDLEQRVARENELKIEVDRLSSRIETLTNDKALADTQIAELRERLSALEQTLNAANARLEEQRAEIDTLRGARDAAAAERDDYSRQLQALQSDKSEVATQLEQVSDALREREVELAAAQRAAGEAAATAAEAVANAERTVRERGERAAALASNLGSIPGAETIVAEEAVIVRIPSDSLFQTGTVLLSQGGTGILQSVARGLGGMSYEKIMIEGHTDSVPVRNMPFVDNWDLAAARASTVTRWFAQETDVPAAKLTATSHAFFEPVADNESPDGRRQNRRVEIVIVP